MKKWRFVRHAMLAVFCVLSTSAVCGCASDSQADKALRILSGVQEVLDDPKASPVSSGVESLVKKEEALDIESQAFSYMSEETGRSAPDIDDANYPYLQLAFAKDFFEDAGDSWKDGTVYGALSEGNLYWDVEKNTSSDSGTAYSLLFLLRSSLEGDVLKLDFGFDCSFPGTEYGFWFYSGMTIDYDFEVADPTFALSVVSEDENFDMPSTMNDGASYERCSVDAKSGLVDDFTQFYYTADRRITIDEENPSFASYAVSGIGLVTGGKGYHDGVFYKAYGGGDDGGEINASVQAALAALYCDSLGMNSTAIGGPSFIAEAYDENSALQKIQKDMEATSSGGLVSLLIGLDDAGGSQQDDDSYQEIRTVSYLTSETCSFVSLSGDASLKELLTGIDSNSLRLQGLVSSSAQWEGILLSDCAVSYVTKDGAISGNLTDDSKLFSELSSAVSGALIFQFSLLADSSVSCSLSVSFGMDHA